MKLVEVLVDIFVLVDIEFDFRNLSFTLPTTTNTTKETDPPLFILLRSDKCLGLNYYFICLNKLVYFRKINEPQ